MCHPNQLAPVEVTLIPKLRVQFAEFLQHSSLKRLGMLYLSTCVGLGYGLCWWSYFLEPAHCNSNPIRSYNSARSVTTTRPTNINVVPIVYAFLPRLRGRLTLRRLTLRRNPWTFGDSVFHTVCRYSCQHSHFRCLQEPSRVSLHGLTERSATARLKDEPKASAHGLSPGTSSAQKPLFRPVSCYAFFK